MPNAWTESVANYLLDTSSCPRCNTTLASTVCHNCGADLGGAKGAGVAQASRVAADALRDRQALIDGLETKPQKKPLAAAATVVPANGSPVTRNQVTGRPASQISVQSVLAVAGAGLFAVAAIVFTFFNPDLTNFETRTAIIAAITVLFLGAAWLLAHRMLQFSAEAVGALGAVFAALDVWAFSSRVEGTPTGWLFLAIGAAAASVLLIALAVRVRVRTWLWSGLLGMQLVPLFICLSIPGRFSAVVGFVAVGYLGIGVHLLARRLGPRFDGTLLADRVTATTIQVVTLPIIAVQLTISVGGGNRTLAACAIIASIAVMSALAARFLLPGFWSYLAGALAVTAVALLPLSVDFDSPAWVVALIPGASGVGLAIVAVASRLRMTRPRAVHAGGATIAALCAVPLALIVTAQAGTAVAPLAGVDLGVIPQEFGLATLVGLAATAVGFVVLSFGAATPGLSAVGYRTTAVWFGAAALVAFATWSAFLRPAQAIIALGLGVAVSLAVALIPRLRALGLRRRVAAVFGAHSLVVLAAMISWTEIEFRVPVGVGIVAAVLVLSLAVSRAARPLYVGAAYAYALAIIAAALTQLGFETIAVLCLTTAIGAIAALVATLTAWLGVRSWYAVLLVTSVPFVIGVVGVLIERSGWTALSTGVTFALLLALVITRREGMTRLLRTTAAALLVPAVAVVVICLGAQVLSVSASPITLPVIAAIVAGTLPATGIIGTFLLRHNIREPDARSARIAIEVSSLVTGAIAVLLALVRAAAGIPTTFLVLLILGIGAIATAMFAKRAYGWPVAGAALTGALWCVWSLAGITLIEPYLLPPAIGTALAGAFLVARGLPGVGLPAIGLVWTGLATATLPILVILAVSGSGDAGLPWRAIGLLAGSLLSLALGLVIPRLARFGALRRVEALQAPLLVVAVVAAAGGAIQAVRYGRVEYVVGMTGEARMLPVLAASGVAVALAAVAGRAIAKSDDSVAARITRARAGYVPAVIYLVIGPIFGIRPGWLPILAVLALAVAVLVLMIITTVRARTRDVTLPPVVFLFAVAWCTAVASWSERELRVEAYSLPLGVALLIVGVIAMAGYPHQPSRATLLTWPFGFRGSWLLIGPGILAILLPSVLATGTDPLTQRAILVIALALVAILIGNLRRLAAPFILGIIVLPIENVVVFAVQLGRSIGALPWWITLATAGAVLLVLAVSSERRVGSTGGAAARLRDLR